MPRRGDETKAEALEIVEGVVERVDLELAAIAGASVDFADRKATAETSARRALKTLGEFGECGVVTRGRGSVSGGRRRLSNRSLRMIASRDRGPNRSS